MFDNCEGQSHKTESTDHNFRREKRAETDSNRGPSAYLPNALPLGQTGSLNCFVLFCFLTIYVFGSYRSKYGELDRHTDVDWSGLDWWSDLIPVWWYGKQSTVITCRRDAEKGNSVWCPMKRLLMRSCKFIPFPLDETTKEIFLLYRLVEPNCWWWIGLKWWILCSHFQPKGVDCL